MDCALIQLIVLEIVPSPSKPPEHLLTFGLPSPQKGNLDAEVMTFAHLEPAADSHHNHLAGFSSP